MRASFLTLAVFASACGVSAQNAASRAPDWLSGYWLSCENGEQVAENWIGAGSGTLLGVNLTRGQQTSFEFLQVGANANGGLSYYSMPNGRSPPTEFAMISHEGQRVVFSNPGHDFPQRITYERTGNQLHARIEGEVDGRTQGMDWSFRRAETDAACAG